MSTHASQLLAAALLITSILLFLIFGVALAGRMLVDDLHASSTSGSTRRHAAGPQLSVSHIFDAHSPFRPAGCDNICASKLRMQRYSAAMRRRRSRVEASLSRANNQTSVAGGVMADSIPWGQVNTRPFGGGEFAEYYVTLGMGGPQAQGVLMHVDTGSDVPWVQCQPCEQCYAQKFPIFDPRASSTSSMTNQDDPYCADIQAIPEIGQGADASLCLYQIGYADGTSTFGYIGREQFNFWDAGSGGSNSVGIPGLAYGCGTKNQDGGTGTEASGVLGLGFGRDFSIPEQLDLDGYYNSAFAFCLAPIFSNPNSGWIMFGEGAQPPDNSYLTTPLLQDGLRVFHYVDLVDFVIDNQPVGIPAGVFAIAADGTGGVTVDSADVISLMVTGAYAPFRAAWLAAVSGILGDPGAPGPEGLDACWDYPDVVGLPAISFQFSDGNLFTLSPSATQLIFIDQNNVRRMCWPFLEKRPGDSFSDMVIGAVSLHNTEVVFDTPNQVFAWKPNQC